MQADARHTNPGFARLIQVVTRDGALDPNAIIVREPAPPARRTFWQWLKDMGAMLLEAMADGD